MEQSVRIVRYGADGYTLNCTGGGRVTCMGRGGPWARFFVEASPADPALVRLVPEQARHLVVAANADGNLLSAVPAEEAGEAAEAWFTKHGDERQCRFESLAFPGKSVTTHASSDVVLGAGRGTVFTLEACTRTAVGSRRHRNPEPDSHLVERPGRGGGGSGAFSSSGFLGRAARAAMGAMGRGPAPSPGPRGVALSEADKLHLRRNGYIVLRGTVAPHLVRRAVRTVEGAIGATLAAVTMGHAAEPRGIPPAQPRGAAAEQDPAVVAGLVPPPMRRPGQPPPLVSDCARHEDLLALCFASQLWGTVAALFGGEGRVRRPAAAQVAPRHPQTHRAPPRECVARWYAATGAGGDMGERGGTRRQQRRRGSRSGDAPTVSAEEAGRMAAATARDRVRGEEQEDRGGAGAAAAAGSGQGDHGRWHVDGMDRRQQCGFSLLAGVMLSSLPAPDMGNLTVFPGSQDVLAAGMAAYGEQWLFSEAAKHSLDMAPVQVTCEAGDVILAHPLLAHRVGVNYSPHVRHAAFFRFIHATHEELQPHVRSDLWVELPGAQ